MSDRRNLVIISQISPHSLVHQIAISAAIVGWAMRVVGGQEGRPRQPTHPIRPRVATRQEEP